MRREYPYLHDTYFTNTETENKVTRSILRDIENFVNQKQYIRMTLLDWEENPIREIQGEISSGSLSKVAQSPVRRSGSLGVAVDAGSYSVDDAKADFAINKKIFIEIGIRNDTDKYPNFPIFWFPEGVFFIGSFSINSSANGSTNINLTIKDKMAMLNGEIGGTLPAVVTFDTMDTQLPDGTYVTKKVLIYNIIQELVNHFGKESLNNIVIEDVPLRIRRVMQWTGNKPLYLEYFPSAAAKAETLEDEDVMNFVEGYYPVFTLTKPAESTTEGISTYRTYYAGDDVGYIRDDFVVIDELVGNAGETVTQILDKIVNILGNYEYFYDVFGVFHFREIKNYLHHTLGERALTELNEKDYLIDINQSKNVFSFSDKTLLTSITTTPLYENIKNDYIIEGIHKDDSTGIAQNVRYHLAIDKKPRPIGKDNRRYIKELWDRSEDKEKVKKAIDELNRWLSLLQANRQKELNMINSYERVKLQRYEQLASHGDVFKERLNKVLGEYSSPNNQSLFEDEKQAYFSDKDYYTHLLDSVFEEAMNQNTGYPTAAILNKTDALFLEAIKKTEQYLSDSKNIEFFNGNVFTYLLPESYWKLLIGQKIDSDFSEEDSFEQEGVLQTAYKIYVQNNYLDKKTKWDKAVAEVTKKQSKTFAELPDKYKNPLTGYTKEKSNLITDNYLNSIEEPENIEWLENLPSAKKLRISISDLENFFEEDSEEEIIAKMKLLYSSYFTLLIDEEENQKKAKANLARLEENLASYLSSLAEIEKRIAGYQEFINNFIVYDEKDKNTEYSVTYTYEGGTFTISNKKVKYTDAEGILKTWLEKRDAEKEKISNVKERIANLSSKINVVHWLSAFDFLKEYWDKYIAEKNLIKEYQDKIDALKKKYDNGIFKSSSDILEEIDKLCLKNIYKGTSLEIETNDEGEIIKRIIPLVEDPSSTPSLIEILKNCYQDASLKTDKNYYIEEGNLYNVEKVYPILIKELENILTFWEKNPNYIAVNNPRLGQPYYHVFSTRTMVLYEEEGTGLIKAGFVYSLKEDEGASGAAAQEWPSRPEVGNFNLIYQGETPDDLGYYYWDGSAYKALTIKGIYEPTNTDVPLNLVQESSNNIEDYGSIYCVYDWRTFLYLQGVYAKINGTDKGYYFEELDAFWPQVYDLKNQWFYGQEDLDPNNERNYDGNKLCSGYYFLDFLDSVSTSYGEWSVDNIGRRTDVISNDEINCLFEPEIPNLNILNAVSASLPKEVYSLEDEWTLERLRQESIEEGEPYTQVGDDIFENLATGGYRNSAYEQLKYELYLHTRYQKSVSISSIPVFYLEPNSRVTILDSTTQTFGDFVIQSINLTFGPGANMSISATETLERF